MVADKVQILKFIDHQYALIELRFDGVVRVIFKDNFVMDVPSQELLFELYKEICEGEKHPFLFTAMKDVVITKEARENSKKLELESPSIATAIFTTSLPYKLMANFYFNFNKPVLPFRIFKDESKAVEWLLEEFEKYKKKGK